MAVRQSVAWSLMFIFRLFTCFQVTHRATNLVEYLIDQTVPEIRPGIPLFIYGY